MLSKGIAITDFCDVLVKFIKLLQFFVCTDRAPNLGLVERFNFGLLPRFNLSLVARFNFGLPT